jgi:hypothetical protein
MRNLIWLEFCPNTLEFEDKFLFLIDGLLKSVCGLIFEIKAFVVKITLSLTKSI